MGTRPRGIDLEIVVSSSHLLLVTSSRSRRTRHGTHDAVQCARPHHWLQPHQFGHTTSSAQHAQVPLG